MWLGASRRTRAMLAGQGILLLVLSLLAGLRPAERFDRLEAAGQPFFWAGVNYPWKSYQDFGTGAWGHSGVSDPTSYEEIDTDFANMAAQGIRVVKWRVFSDGRYAPTFDEQGFTTGLSPEFWADVDGALAIAKKHGIYLVFTLFNSQLWVTNCSRQGVRFGWGPTIIEDTRRRAALLHSGVEPFLRHVAKSDRVLAFEVIAEPEWGIAELHTEQDWRQKTSLADLRAFVRDLVRAVHGNTKALATVESNRPAYMQYWRGLDLDYYSFSWYDWMAPYDPLDKMAADYQLDRPIVLGEFPVATSEHYTLDQALGIAYRQGYAGAFAWSFAAADQFSKWEAVRKDFVDWVQQHWGDVQLAASASPPEADAPVVPQPYGRSEARFHVERGLLVADVDFWPRAGGDFIAKFFLYPGDGSSNEALAEREHFISVPQGKSQLLSAVFDGLADGKPYKLSLGIFDTSYSLLKWFDGIATFTVANGEIEQPKLSTEQIENPCYGIN